MSIHIDFLNKDFDFTEADQWWTFSKESDLYDVHYNEDYGELIVYEFDPELDGQTHRFKIVAKQTLFNNYEDWLNKMQLTGEYCLKTLLSFKDYYQNMNTFEYNTEQFKNFTNVRIGM